MPAFKKFGPGDQVDNVLVLEPAYNLASGSGGWRGSPEGSASLSLYGGARRNPVHAVSDVAYQSIFPGVGQVPKPRIGLPTTASLNFVWMTDEVLGLTQRSSTRWGHEHWSTVQRLYNDYQYRDPDFVTASYDHYVLYFQKDSTNVVAVTGGLKPNVYPSSSAQMNSALGGFGTFQMAWLLDEPAGTGGLTASFGGMNLNQNGGTSVVQGEPGALIPGNDLSIRFPDQVSSTNFNDPTVTIANIYPTYDLIMAYVGRWRALPAAGFGNVLGRINGAATQGWSFGGTDGSHISFFGGPNGNFGSNINDYLVGEWHVGIGVVDRSNGLMQFGVRSLNTGRTVIGGTSPIGNASLTSSNPFAIGYTGWVNQNDNFNLAALYLGSGSAVATGVQPNLPQVLANFANYLGKYATPTPSASFTLESWVKPFAYDNPKRDHTIQSRNNLYWLGITGSSGYLAFSSSFGIFTASDGPAYDQWSHVAVTYNSGTQIGTFYLNLTQVGTFSMPPLTGTDQTTLYTIGNVLVPPNTGTEMVSTPGGSKAFHGFIGESRAWHVARSWVDLSASYNVRLTGSVLTASHHCLYFNEGPLSRVYNYPMGSGTVDRARLAKGAQYQTARLLGFDDRPGPSWHPSDNTNFFVPKQLAPSFVTANSSVEPAVLQRGDDLHRMLVIDAPQAFYGRQVVPGTVFLTDRSYSTSSFGLVRVLNDDGRGNLYLYGGANSGTVTLPYVGYPASPAEMNLAVGYGTWTDAWMMDETDGNLNSIFPSGTVFTPVGGIENYGGTGPLNPKGGILGASDRSVSFGTQVGSYFQVLPANANSLYSLAPTDDLIIAWVVRNRAVPAAYNGLINKHDPVSTGSWWSVVYGNDTTLTFEISCSAGVLQSSLNPLPYGSWHVGMAALDRSINQIRIGVMGFDASFQKLGVATTIPADALQNQSGMTLGSLLGALDALSNSDIAAVYIGKGNGAATGSVANMGTALTNLVTYLNRRAVPATASVGWNKVGNVFYGEGLMTVKDPSLLDFGSIHPDAIPETASPSDVFQLSFRGQSRIPVKTLMCRVDRGDFNATLNPTFWTDDGGGNRVRRHPSGSLYATTVGVYNSDRELVGVARLAEPIRLRARDRINIKLRMDF